MFKAKNRNEYTAIGKILKRLPFAIGLMAVMLVFSFISAINAEPLEGLEPVVAHVNDSIYYYPYENGTFGGKVPINPLKIYASKDTYLRENYPDKNYGAAAVWVGSGGPSDEPYYKDRGLFWFDISSIPADFDIISAKFYLAYNNEFGTDCSGMWIYVHRVTSQWSEGGATWNNMASNYDSSSVGSEYVPISTPGTWFSWDITSLVEDWYNGNYPNCGLMMIGYEYKDCLKCFYSKEFSNGGVYKPYLEVSYSPQVDLTFFSPPSSWQGSLVISHTDGKRSTDTVFYDNKDIYVSWAVQNSASTDITSTFKNTLYIDNSPKKSWYTNGLSAWGYYIVNDYNIGKLSQGVYNIEIEADVNDNIEETSEINNEDWEIISVTTNNPPNPCTLVSPSNGATVSPNVVLKWDCTDPDGDTVVNYYLQIDDNSDFSSPLFSGQTGSSQKEWQPSAHAVTLDRGVTYYWRVKGYDGKLWGGYSSRWHFKINRLANPPTLTYPPDGMMGETTTVTLDWEQCTDPDGHSITDYCVQIAKNSGFSPTLFSDRIHSTNTQWNPSDHGVTLQKGTTYYWRVGGYDDIECGSYSSSWSFKIVTYFAPIMHKDGGSAAECVQQDGTLISAKFSSDYGPRHVTIGTKFHPGIDIPITTGTPVYAIKDGIAYHVIENGIVVVHNDGTQAEYLHLSQRLVGNQINVRAGQKIGYSGSYGSSQHLHFDSGYNQSSPPFSYPADLRYDNPLHELVYTDNGIPQFRSNPCTGNKIIGVRCRPNDPGEIMVSFGVTTRYDKDLNQVKIEILDVWGGHIESFDFNYDEVKDVNDRIVTLTNNQQVYICPGGTDCPTEQCNKLLQHHPTAIHYPLYVVPGYTAKDNEAEDYFHYIWDISGYPPETYKIKVTAIDVRGRDCEEESTWNILCGNVSDVNVGPLAPGVPYLVVGNVEVPTGQTLTIEPGAEIYFKSGRKITAYGTLHANGNLGDPIYLTSVEDVGHRNGIKLNCGLRLQNGGELKLGIGGKNV